MKQLFAILLAALTAAAWAQTGSPASASNPQFSDAANWYQVEVILFAQADSFGNEANLKSVKLTYPEKRVFLQAQSSQPDPQLMARLKPDDATLVGLVVPEPQRTRRDPHLPQAFAPLDPSARVLNAEASSLERSGTYQVLFHQAWMQPMQGARSTPWIIIEGGKQIGEHHELEGSLRFFVDSHLNVQTNLWRTRFGLPQQRAGALTGEPLSTEDPMATEVPGADAKLPDTAQWPELPPAPEPPKVGLPAILAALIDTGDFSDYIPGDNQQEAPAALYRVEDIDRFEHSQRLNSRDLHYLDHPRLGMLVRLSPWVPPGSDIIDESGQESLDDGDATIIDEMELEEGTETDDALSDEDEARD